MTAGVLDDLRAGARQGLVEAKRLLNADLVAAFDERGDEMARLSGLLFHSAVAQERMAAALRRASPTADRVLLAVAGVGAAGQGVAYAVQPALAVAASLPRASAASAPVAPAHCSIVPPYLLEALARPTTRRWPRRPRPLSTSTPSCARAATPPVAAAPTGRAPRGRGWHRAPPPGRCAPSTTRSTAPRCRAPWCAPRATRPPATRASPRPTTGSATPGSSGSRPTAATPSTARACPWSASVHYGTDYDNAFWDGTQMVFGDGDGVVFRRSPAASTSSGHELAHGVTQYTAGLNYQGQSGALNESVSDVFGVLVKQRLLGQTADQADWLIGAELLAPGVNGVALRSMAAPGTAYDDPRLGKDPQPAHMSGYVDTTDDNGGVHINSGIPNKAFHVAATTLGGNAWEAAGQVWVDTITGDISADCDFATFARLTVAAATARHGADSEVVAAVQGRAGMPWGASAAESPPTTPTAPAPHHGGPAPAGPGPSPTPGPATRSACAARVGSPGAPSSAPSPWVSCPTATPVPGTRCSPTTACPPWPSRSPTARRCPTPTATACAARRRPSTSSCPSSSLTDDVRSLLERTLGTSDG